MKKSFWVAVLALTGSLMFSITAFAGNINSAEQKIIDAISGTYEYDGAYYKVTDAYIAKVIEQLNRDDIDMTEFDAQSYIRQFMDNIAVGISSGYMVKVGDVGESDSSSDNTDGNDSNSNNTGNNSNTDNNGNTGNNGNTDNNGNNTDNNSNTNNNSNDNNSSTDNNGNAADNKDNNSAAGTDTDINSGTDNPLTGFIPQLNPETGVIEDNTLGSTTDGEIEYTVFSIDRETMYVWDIDTLDVHTEAYKDSEIIGTLNKGDAVVILGAATTGWAQIEYEDTLGYVSAVYLRTQGYMNAMNADVSKEDTTEEEEAGAVKDYSNAAPLTKSLNLAVVALVIVLVFTIGVGVVIIWHRNKIRKR